MCAQIKPGAALTFRNIIWQEVATAGAYRYTPDQPYLSVGICTGTWPTILSAPNATVRQRHVAAAARTAASHD